jgi:hypothetical protein
VALVEPRADLLATVRDETGARGHLHAGGVQQR